MKIKLLLLCLLMAMLLSSCSAFRPADVQSEESSSKIETSAPESTDAESVPETESVLRPVIPVKDPSDPPTICIDAGHGYVDPGCSTKYLGDLTESEIVADYAELLKDKLESEGFRVILLRNNDDYVDAARITEAAKSMGMSFLEDKIIDDRRFAPYNRAVWTNVLHRETYIDLFISIHIDSFESMESVRGTRIYYCSDTSYSTASAEYCEALAEAVKTALPDTNARSFPKPASEAYAVTEHTEMPSVLVEIGFATNKTDAENILDETYRDEFCGALVEGMKDYLGKLS